MGKTQVHFQGKRSALCIAPIHNIFLHMYDIYHVYCIGLQDTEKTMPAFFHKTTKRKPLVHGALSEAPVS